MKRSAIILSLLVPGMLACGLFPALALPTPTRSAGEDPVALMVTQTLAALATAQRSTPAPLVQPTEETTPAPPETTEPLPLPTRGIIRQPGELLVTYTLNGDVYLWRDDDTHTRLTTHGQAREVFLAPDAEWIAYTRQVDTLRQEIWAVSPDGSENKLLVGVGDLAPSEDAIALLPDQVMWARSGDVLLYNTVLSYAGPGMPASNDLRSVNVDTLEKELVLPAGSGGGRFYFSPNGQILLLVRSNGFAIANPDGSGLREIFSFPEIYTYSEWVYLPDPVWNSDSAGFRVIIPPQDSLGQPDDATIIWEIPVVSGPARQLGAFVGSPAWRSRPLLSPNGALVVYLVDRPGGTETTELHLANADLTADQVLRSGNMRLENWSPDSKLFVLWVSERRELQAGSVSGSFFPWPVGIKPIRLKWVDAARFLIISGTYETPDLYLGNRNGAYAPIVSSSAPELSFDFLK